MTQLQLYSERRASGIIIIAVQIRISLGCKARTIEARSSRQCVLLLAGSLPHCISLENRQLETPRKSVGMSCLTESLSSVKLHQFPTRRNGPRHRVSCSWWMHSWSNRDLKMLHSFVSAECRCRSSEFRPDK